MQRSKSYNPSFASVKPGQTLRSLRKTLRPLRLPAAAGLNNAAFRSGSMEPPIVNQLLLLKKFPGKGGWTYAEVPELAGISRANFGWVRVKGTIDNYEVSDYSLAPMKGGKLFLPVKSEIRKKIKKQAGDYIQVVLYRDYTSFEVPEEIIDCLLLDDRAYEVFNKLSKSDQRQYVKWIYAAKREETRTERIGVMMGKLLRSEV